MTDPMPGEHDDCDDPYCAALSPAALRAPSEPVQDQPRVWAMPPEPGPEVTRLRDVYGQGFERATAYGDDEPEEGWLGDAFTTEADVPDLFLTWKQLMANHSPLTEVVNTGGD